MNYLLDIKYACRLLAKSPVFSLLTTVVLAGGLAVSIFSYSFLHTFVFSDLPIDEGHSVVKLQATEQGYDRMFDAVDFAEIRPGISTLSEFGMYYSTSVLLDINGQSQSHSVTFTEWNMFQFSRTQPIKGRAFRSDDSSPSSEKVAVISYAMWQSKFLGKQDIIDSFVKVDGKTTRIIGVMPEGYGFPVASRFWLPIEQPLFTTQKRDQVYVDIYARINPSTSEKMANNELSRLAKNTYNARRQNSEVAIDDIYITTFQAAQTNGADGIIVFTILNIVTGFIFLLAAINVGNLLLARMNERAKEISIRVALGAPQKRLIVQMMWESIIICVTGGIIALLLSGWALQQINQFWINMDLADGLAYWWHWGLDINTILVTIIFIIIAIIMTGVLPALHVTSGDFNATLRGGTRGAASSKGNRVTRVLLTTEITVVTVLMYLGIISSFFANQLINLDIGLNTTNILSAQVQLTPERYNAQTTRNAFYRTITSKLQQQNSITDVVVTASFGKNTFMQQGVSYQLEQDKPQAVIRSISENINFTGVEIIEGRYIDTRDQITTMPVVMISKSVADTFWREGSAIGKQLKISDEVEGEKTWATIVGIVSDRVEGTPISDPKNLMTLYRPLTQLDSNNVNIEYKFVGAEPQARSLIYEILYTVDSEIKLTALKSMEELLAMLRDLTHSATQLFLKCGLFALALGVTGIYGLTANSITQRQHEIGIRRALGANDSNIVRWLIKLGANPLIKGLGIGLVLSTLLSIVTWQLIALDVYLYFISAAIVMLIIIASVSSAIYVPARKAIQLEPSETLRCED
ncbi:FtsX-like permease family protein [Pseudoalteromonas sp. MMG012]|uniref:FtsX-like permease family protein n=1 Tax=Pseudoalteromonas sp. MMG012 TaxID=2822686 RepID=UPI001B3A05F7|nr:ABC transporter permease [Pseudoalteromonas sp. MMG012]MBQ4850858.1 ABC transporter permease [Pseudoalteromonas sp. MMG012]